MQSSGCIWNILDNLRLISGFPGGGSTKHRYLKSFFNLFSPFVRFVCSTFVEERESLEKTEKKEARATSHFLAVTMFALRFLFVFVVLALAFASKKAEKHAAKEAKKAAKAEESSMSTLMKKTVEFGVKEKKTAKSASSSSSSSSSSKSAKKSSDFSSKKSRMAAFLEVGFFFFVT